MKVITSEAQLIRALTSYLRRDGCFRLIFQGQRQVKELRIENQNIQSATSNLLQDRFTEILFKAGKLSREQYMLATELSIMTRKRAGEILVHEGFLSENHVAEGLRDQAAKIICSLFEHPDWKMKVSEFPPDPSIQIVPRLSLLDAVIVGVRSVDNLSVLYEALPLKEEILETWPDHQILVQGIRMTPDEEQILSLVDGKRSLKQILKESKMWDYRFYKTLYPLVTLKILKSYKKPFEVSMDEETDITALSYAEDPGEIPVQAPSAEPPLSAADSDSQLEEAKFLISTEQYSTAANKLKNLISTDSNKSAYYYYLGLALDHIPGQNKEAEKVLKMAIRLENYNPRYYLALGYLYLNRNMKQKAKEQFMTAMKWDSKDPYVREAIRQLNQMEKKESGLLSKRIFRKS